MTDTPDPAPKAGWLANRWLAPTALGVAALSLVMTGVAWADFDGRVRAYLLANPQILDEVVAARETAETEGQVGRINAAAEANAPLLRVTADDVVFGPAQAGTTVIQYFDYRCPGCKAVSPEFVQLMQRHPDVRFVFRDWPILDGREEGVSRQAARAALAAHRQGKYLPVYSALMAERALTPERIDAILRGAGVDLTRARADMASAEIARHLAAVEVSGQTLQLIGTPTFFINGRTTASIEPRAVEAAILGARRGGGSSSSSAKPSAPAGPAAAA